MKLVPTRTQWSRWSLPSKLTSIGTLLGLVALLLTVVQFWPRAAAWSLDPAIVPEPFITVSIAPIPAEDLRATWFLPGKWAFSTLGPVSSAPVEERVYQSAAAFRLVLTSALPPGQPEPVIEALSMVVVAKRRIQPRPPVTTFLFSGGGADGPVDFADFARSRETTWPLRWRAAAEGNDLGYSRTPGPLTFKYLRPGENIVVLVTEGPSVDGLVDDQLPDDELIELAARLDARVGGNRISVFSRERLLLLEYSHSDHDVLEPFGIRTMDGLQQRAILADASAPGIGPATAARDLWEASQAVAQLRTNPASRKSAIESVKTLAGTGERGDAEARILADLAQRIQR